MMRVWVPLPETPPAFRPSHKGRVERDIRKAWVLSICGHGLSLPRRHGSRGVGQSGSLGSCPRGWRAPGRHRSFAFFQGTVSGARRSDFRHPTSALRAGTAYLSGGLSRRHASPLRPSRGNGSYWPWADHRGLPGRSDRRPLRFDAAKGTRIAGATARGTSQAPHPAPSAGRHRSTPLHGQGCGIIRPDSGTGIKWPGRRQHVLRGSPGARPGSHLSMRTGEGSMRGGEPKKRDALMEDTQPPHPEVRGAKLRASKNLPSA